MRYPARKAAGALFLGSLLFCGCGQDMLHGPYVLLSGNFNNWAQRDSVSTLTMADGVYSGIVALPGDALKIRIYSPTDGALVGSSGGDPAAIPSTVATSGDSTTAIQIDTPLAARYQLTYDPGKGLLHIDLAADADQGQSPGGAALIRALRGSDQADAAENQLRSQTLIDAFNRNAALQTPLLTAQADSDLVTYKSITFLQLDGIDSRDVVTSLSVVGDFNGWTEGKDPMHMVLDRRIAYRARQGSGVRLEYRIAMHGERHADLHNPEVVWDGASLPPNLRNLMGGNVGAFNSVAMGLDYVEQGSRLQRLVISGQHEVYVYLPPGYAGSTRTYPSLYIHDGKDAIVRGRYDQALDQLIAYKSIPPLVAIFAPAESDATARLAQYSHFPDPYFTQVQPAGAAYAQFLTGTLVPTIDRSYRTIQNADQRAMLGIDMAGPFTFYVGWASDSPFHRLASQSGRFGWGPATTQPGMLLPYVSYLSQDRSATLKRLSFDWANVDQFQVAANSQLTADFSAAYGTSIRFYQQTMPLNLPNPDAWDNWRARLSPTLSFLLGDLVSN